MKAPDMDQLLRNACAARRTHARAASHKNDMNYLLISRYLEGVATDEERRTVDAWARTNADVAEMLRPMDGVAPGAQSVYRLPTRFLFGVPWSRALLRCAAMVALLVSGAFCVGYATRGSRGPAVAAATSSVASTERVLVFRGIQCPYAAAASNVCEVTISVDDAPEEAP
jgi:hypothetical protein